MIDFVARLTGVAGIAFALIALLALAGAVGAFRNSPSAGLRVVIAVSAMILICVHWELILVVLVLALAAIRRPDSNTAQLRRARFLHRQGLEQGSDS